MTPDRLTRDRVKLEDEIVSLRQQLAVAESEIKLLREHASGLNRQLAELRNPVLSRVAIDLDSALAEGLVLECLEPSILAATVRMEHTKRKQVEEQLAAATSTEQKGRAFTQRESYREACYCEACAEFNAEADTVIETLVDDANAQRKQIAALENNCRCPQCGCASPEDAESKECGCDGPVCKIEAGDTLAKAYERVVEKLAAFNTHWQHDPPQVGDTRWVRQLWHGNMVQEPTTTLIEGPAE